MKKRNKLITSTFFATVLFATGNSAFAEELPKEEQPKTEVVTNNKKTEANVITTITNQKLLNEYLERTGQDFSGDILTFKPTENISFPKNTYTVTNGHFILNFPKGATDGYDLNFNGSTFLLGKNGYMLLNVEDKQGTKEDPRVIENYNVVGSVTEETQQDGSYKSNWRGRFKGNFVGSENVTIKNAHFSNAHHSDDHIFDLMGVNNVEIDGIESAGYGGENFTQEILKKRYKKNNHSVYSEVIQIDGILRGALGDPNALPNGSLFKNYNEKINNKSSKNVTIKNSKFTDFKGLNGQSLIDGTEEETVRRYGGTLGSHTTGSTGYENIIIENNEFINTIHVDGVEDPFIRPIHILAGISNGKVVKEDDYIRSTTKNIIVRNNKISLGDNRVYLDERDGVIDNKSHYITWDKTQENNILSEQEQQAKEIKNETTDNKLEYTKLSNEQLQNEKETNKLTNTGLKNNSIVALGMSIISGILIFLGLKKKNI
ncbi:hypothetical protein HZY83_05410 [Gemella sp. GH3]|uniref:hypothetical protein n=1 Tax=unclassified Gemella TaxID=2624949 RepID=UPI0015CFE789|nr:MULTISPECIES: hypothetical protein [unclassified Gemella]MBF0714109.1 hypothetical protein [Gemella sp. GH3.1]NYS51061.1 hypothetical protein [Gemella sp. GH3]